MPTKEYYDEIYRLALGNARPKPKPKPVLATVKGKEVEHTKPANAKPTDAVIDAATTHNHALADRLETMEGRRQKQIAKELAENNDLYWNRLVDWWQSKKRTEEARKKHRRKTPKGTLKCPPSPCPDIIYFLYI